MGTTPHNKTRYAAFISYAHVDEAVAARLHKALEIYPVPKHLRAQGKVTKPVFRDVAELTAAHSLSEKIRDAVKSSRVLIVLCSPAAKASHWVNEEIRLFREIHGDAAILSAIIDGTPATAFPDALIEGGREPLAAALGTDKAGFKLGVTQLAAGMLGTGLDELVQRGAKRRQRILGAGLAASIALSGVMGFTTLQAVEARKEAEVSRADAEGLVEYMIKDLKFKLEPVGRLDLLEGIGEKAVEYYDKQDIKTLSDDSLIRQAAARQVLAQVALDAGRLEDAQKEIEASAALTREVLERNPNDADAIFAHAQSEYYVGDYYRRQGKLAEMEAPWGEYDRLAQVLYQKDPTNFDWVMEAAWGQNNLGILAREKYSSKYAQMALEHYSKSIDYFDKAIELDPTSKLAKVEFNNAMSGKGEVLLALENRKTAESFQLNYLKNFETLASSYPDDIGLKNHFIKSQIGYRLNFFLEHNDQNAIAIYKAFDELFELTKYDIENMEYKKNFLDSVFENVDIFSLERLIKTKNQVEMTLFQSRNFNRQDILYYNSMLEIIQIKINNSNGQEKLAKSNLVKLNEIYKNATDKNSNNRRVFYILYRENLEQSNIEEAKYFAQKFLDNMESLSDLDFPLPSFYKMEANFTLKNCLKANSLARNLRARGYIDSTLYDKFHCA